VPPAASPARRQDGIPGILIFPECSLLWPGPFCPILVLAGQTCDVLSPSRWAAAGPLGRPSSPGALSAAGPLRFRGPAVPCNHYQTSRRGAYIAPAIPVDTFGHGFAHSGVRARLKTSSGHGLPILVSARIKTRTLGALTPHFPGKMPGWVRA